MTYRDYRLLDKTHAIAHASSLVCAEDYTDYTVTGVIVGVVLAAIFLLVFCIVSLQTQKAAKLSRKDEAQNTLAQSKWLGCMSGYPPVLCDFSHRGLWLFLKVCIHTAPAAQLSKHTMKSLPLISNSWRDLPLLSWSSK